MEEPMQPLDLPLSTQDKTGQEPSVMRSVFRAILLETIKDFFVSILVFFRKYIRHYRVGLSYLWNPSFTNRRLQLGNWKEYTQHTFELAILMLLAIIFMVKLEWIPKGSQEVMDMLNNDLSQMAIEVMLFLGFALTFIIATFLSIVTGRALRLIFEEKITRQLNDILFAYLNNVAFTLMLVFLFIFRCSFSLLTMEDETTTTLSAIWVMLFFTVVAGNNYMVCAVWQEKQFGVGKDIFAHIYFQFPPYHYVQFLYYIPGCFPVQHIKKSLAQGARHYEV